MSLRDEHEYAVWTAEWKGGLATDVSGRGHGDLHVIAGVAVPTKLTKDQKHLLEELSKTLPRQEDELDRQDADKPFFERVKDIFG